MKEGEILIYQTEDGKTKVETHLVNDSVWLTQKQLAYLYDIGIQTINYHIKEIFASGELEQRSTIRKFRIVQKEGARIVSREMDFYNLDAIISIGYRVNSSKATQFRIWATQRLKDYLVQGYAVNEHRLEELKRIVKVIEQTGITDGLNIFSS